MKIQVVVRLLSLSTAVLAHGGVQWYSIDRKQYLGNFWYLDHQDPPVPPLSPPSIQRRWDMDPIFDPFSSNLTCNYDGASTLETLHAPISAGGNITGHWTPYDPSAYPTTWPHLNGPLLTYLAACPGSCDGFDGSGKVWFKIDQLGLEPGPNTINLLGPWWQGDLLNGAGYTITIPKNLKAGNYLIRTEVIMLTSAPAQYYPNCAQLTVTGDGTATPGDAFFVAFPGAYSPDDPGIIIADWTMYPEEWAGREVPAQWQSVDYKFPGPLVWTGE